MNETLTRIIKECSAHVPVSLTPPTRKQQHAKGTEGNITTRLGTERKQTEGQGEKITLFWNNWTIGVWVEQDSGVMGEQRWQ
jgi:hypothetical protein